MRPIVLASTSRYRRELLGRLRLPFTVDPPEVDETPAPGEPPAALAERLAHAKARAVAPGHPGAIVIGSDQVADLDGRALGKPGNHAAARAQLTLLQGREVVFHTAVAVVAPDGHARGSLVPTVVRFRRLGPAAIDAYLAAEPAYDCAGSAKVEALGIALLESVRSDDPTALVGLPLIALAGLLAAAGVEILPGLAHPSGVR